MPSRRSAGAFDSICSTRGGRWPCRPSWSSTPTSCCARRRRRLTDAARRERVLTYWAPPSEEPARPPPHSTGAAINLTLVDAGGVVVNMGSPFDEPTERSHPDHFAGATDASGQEAHANRQLLAQVMRAAGFVGHPQEWWHFSHGDRAWAREHDLPAARYGRTEPAPFTSP